MKNPSRSRETQAEYLGRIVDSLHGLKLRSGPETVRVRHGKPPPVAMLENARIDLGITSVQNRALGAHLEHCEAGGHGCLSICDLPDINTKTGLSRILTGLTDAVDENRRLRAVLGDRVIRRIA